MFTVVRIDSPNYGFVVSQHSSFGSAESALDKKAAAISRKVKDAQSYLMFRIVDNVAAKTKAGTRVRLPE
jgi:hypothetical protein